MNKQTAEELLRQAARNYVEACKEFAAEQNANLEPYLASEDDPKSKRRCKCEFSGGGYPSKVCAYHQALIDKIGAIPPGYRLVDDFWIDKWCNDLPDAAMYELYLLDAAKGEEKAPPKRG